MSSTERSKKRRLDPVKRATDNFKRKNARQLKAKNNPLSTDELEKKREADRLRKAASRLNQSSQKKVGIRLKDRNRKALEGVERSAVPTSTERVRKHRENIIKFNFRSKKQKAEHVAKDLNTSLSVLSPQSKVHAVSKSCNNNLSPASRHIVANNIQGDPLADFTNTISKKRDRLSNCARRLVIGSIVKKSGGNWKTARRTNRHLSWKSLKSASEKDINDMIKHYKSSVKSKAQKPPTETTKKVVEFYNRDDVSRQLPYKNLTRKVKDHLGVYHRVPMRVMEVTLRNAFTAFKNDNANIKISQRTFEQLRPKYIRLRRYAQRLQCCCTYHTNIDYIRKACNNLFLKNGKEIPFPDNDALISSALCASNSVYCIMRICSTCKSFPKIDALDITSLKCSKSCIEENNDCSDHTIKINQFERVTYIHKEKEKKKMKLQDKMMKLNELVALLNLKLEKFPMHRFNVQHTAKTFDNLINNLNENSIIKIHDFSENYTCLLPEEIQSLHWVQETATVYPIVVMRKIGDDVREDHLVFISDDKKHDVPFVEKCNEILHQHYVKEGMFITHDIEYNDGCASQFKCIRAFSSLARRSVKTTRIFCETSHGKSKSDGLGGVVKSFASRAVCGERRIIRNAKELTDFFDEMLVVKSAIESHRPMLNRLFFYVSSEDMESYKSAFPSLKYNFISGTLSIHQVVTIPGNKEAILYRNGSCGCSYCLSGTYKECESLDQFKEYPEFIQMVNTYIHIEKGTKEKRESLH